MDSPLPPVSIPTPDRGLPPVQPPSATMLFRLFLVPFLIVGVLVGLYLLGQTLYGKLWRTRSPEKVLRDLDNANPDIRWRAASDLAQELPRSPELASNAAFALELTERLHTTLQEAVGPEKEFAAQSSTLTPAERDARLSKDLVPRRSMIIVLGGFLGNFVVPTGVPLLSQMATQTTGMEPDALAETRRRALVALAVLGEKLKQYDKLSSEEKNRIDEQLEQGNPRWAKPCQVYLRARRQGKADSFGVASVIEKCSTDEDPNLRMYAAYVANFWHGNASEDARIEKVLVALTRDSGIGEKAREERLKKNPDSRKSRPITTKPGYEVQINANIALARRGSPQVRFDLLEEMLDPEQLRSIFLIRSADGKVDPDEPLVLFTLTGSLGVLAELATLRPELRPRIESLLPKVEALAGDPNPALSAEATKTLRIIQGKS